MERSGIQICTRALRQVGVYGPGDSIDDDDMATAFGWLNDMLDAWKLDQLTMLVREIETWPLVALQEVYTIGPGGNFNRQRPPAGIQAASIMDYNNAAQPLELPIPLLLTNEWQNVPVKQVQSGLPTAGHYEPTYPLGKLYLWPVYNASNIKVKTYIDTALETFAAYTTTYDFAPGYLITIQMNLAVYMAPDFGVDMQNYPTVLALASQTLGDLRRSNIKPVVIGVDPEITARGDEFNYYTGQPTRGR
jgi:hypothetical protein